MPFQLHPPNFILVENSFCFLKFPISEILGIRFSPNFINFTTSLSITFVLKLLWKKFQIIQLTSDAPTTNAKYLHIVSCPLLHLILNLIILPACIPSHNRLMPKRLTWHGTPVFYYHLSLHDF